MCHGALGWPVSQLRWPWGPPVTVLLFTILDFIKVRKKYSRWTPAGRTFLKLDHAYGWFGRIWGEGERTLLGICVKWGQVSTYLTNPPKSPVKTIDINVWLFQLLAAIIWLHIKMGFRWIWKGRHCYVKKDKILTYNRIIYIGAQTLRIPTPPPKKTSADHGVWGSGVGALKIAIVKLSFTHSKI